MTGPRVHELGKDIKATSKVLIELLEKYGITVKNHMTTLELDETDVILISYLNKYDDGSTIEEYVSLLVSELAQPVVHIFAIIVSFVLLYFALRLLLTLLFALINLLLNRGLIGVVNKILGCVFTTLFAVIIAWAFVSVFDYALNLPFLSDKEWAMNFDGGYIYKFFKSISPIELLLSF